MDVKDILTPIGTIAAALIAAFLGSLQGARTALSRFKQERGFERRLDAYEKIGRALGEAKLRLEIAKTFQEDPNEPAETKSELWLAVQEQYLEIVDAENVAVLFASDTVYQNLREVREEFDTVSNETEGMDPDALCENPELAYPLIDLLYDAVKVNSTAVRAELGFEEINIPGAENEA